MPVGSFLVVIIPVVAIMCLVLVLRRDPRVANRRSPSVVVLPKSPLARQVRRATKPPRPSTPASEAAKAGPPSGSGNVMPFRPPPRQRAG